MKFNAKMGRAESTGPMVLTNEDILSVVKILVDLRNGRGDVARNIEGAAQLRPRDGCERAPGADDPHGSPHALSGGPIAWGHPAALCTSGACSARGSALWVPRRGRV